MAKVIVDKQKAAKDLPYHASINWGSLEVDWFDWLYEILFEGAEVITISGI